MNCPTCSSATLLPSTHHGLRTWNCPSCQGTWLPSFHYTRYFRAQKESISPPPLRTGEVPPCPECENGLTSASVGEGLAYRVNHCYGCGGVWLDRDSAAKLQEKSDPSREVEKMLETIYRREKSKAEEAAKPNKQTRAPIATDQFTKISKRKPFYPISESLHEYLKLFGRTAGIPPIYNFLADFKHSIPCVDEDGDDTLWLTVSYDPERQKELNRSLSRIYSHLKTGDPKLIEHIFIARIDYCEFGNSKPFRIRVVNQFNDNYDHFYVKVPDASRIFGLELEHTLSPNRFSYLVHPETLIEEHIAGIPGDIFIQDHLTMTGTNLVRVAKEFVKFNERCFVQLLGDMRSYNYVVDVTPDFEETQYRVRAIDFDQQSYEGNYRNYLPQFFKENLEIVKLCTGLLNNATMEQYQTEERTLIRRRVRVEYQRLNALLDCMELEELSPPEKIKELTIGLGSHLKTNLFDNCRTMGEVVRTQIEISMARAD